MELYERVILTLPECFVYKIPPLRAAAGYRAEEWDLENPLTTCYLKVYQLEARIRLVLYCYVDQSNRSTNEENIKLFAECIIELKPNESIDSYIDEVVDSSRYFVIKIKDPKSSRVLRLGIGFRERETAFDLRSSINECLRYVNRMDIANKISLGEYNPENSGTNNIESDVIAKEVSLLMNSRDLSIKEGTKIKISSKGIKNRVKERTSNDEIQMSININPNDKDHSNDKDNDLNEDWGDFIS